MESITHMDIPGYLQEPVPNTFWRVNPDADSLAILYPGYAYSAEMPVLYYPGRLFLNQGMDLLRVEYAYNRRGDFRHQPDEEQSRWIAADAIASLQAALLFRRYSRILLTGKSIGTRAVASVLTGEPLAARAACLWLTPVLNDPATFQCMKKTLGPSLAVIGTADPFYQPALIAELEQAENCQVMVVDGADHSLEIKDDLQGSLRIMEKMVERIAVFLQASRV